MAIRSCRRIFHPTFSSQTLPTPLKQNHQAMTHLCTRVRGKTIFHDLFFLPFPGWREKLMTRVSPDEKQKWHFPQNAGKFNGREFVWQRLMKNFHIKSTIFKDPFGCRGKQQHKFIKYQIFAHFDLLDERRHYPEIYAFVIFALFLNSTRSHNDNHFLCFIFTGWFTVKDEDS